MPEHKYGDVRSVLNERSPLVRSTDDF